MSAKMKKTIYLMFSLLVFLPLAKGDGPDSQSKKEGNFFVKIEKVRCIMPQHPNTPLNDYIFFSALLKAQGKETPHYMGCQKMNNPDREPTKLEKAIIKANQPLRKGSAALGKWMKRKSWLKKIMDTQDKIREKIVALKDKAVKKLGKENSPPIKVWNPAEDLISKTLPLGSRVEVLLTMHEEDHLISQWVTPGKVAVATYPIALYFTKSPWFSGEISYKSYTLAKKVKQYITKKGSRLDQDDLLAAIPLICKVGDKIRSFTYTIKSGAAHYEVTLLVGTRALSKQPVYSSWLGVRVSAAKKGLRVIAVTPLSPAERAGIRPEDMIHFAGTTSLSTAPKLQKVIEANSRITLVILREKKPMTLQIPLGKRITFAEQKGGEQ